MGHFLKCAHFCGVVEVVLGWDRWLVGPNHLGVDFSATSAGSVLEIQDLPNGKSWKVSPTPRNTGVLPIDVSGLLPDVLKKCPF